ncbi:MAG: type II secretion system protein GspM [Sedimenticola sp.]
MNLPNGARGRAVALGILLIPLILLFQYALVPAWQGYQAIGEETAEIHAQLLRYKRLVRDLPELEKQTAALKRSRILAPYFLQGQNTALAAASLQHRLREQVKAQEGRVLSARVLKPETDGPFEIISLNARLQLKLEGLQHLLHAIETQQPYQFVDKLSITAPLNRRRDTNEQILDIRLTVHGLRLIEHEGDPDV